MYGYYHGKIQILQIIIVSLLFCFLSFPVSGEEIFFLGGGVRSSDDDSYAWQVSYMEKLGTHYAWSVSWLNEGHLTDHHRDGPAMQFWAQSDIYKKRLSLAAGIGPYLYFDTQTNHDYDYKQIQHGWGAIGSLALTWQLKTNWLIQGRCNYILADNNIDTATILFGIGYQLDGVTQSDVEKSPESCSEKTYCNELSVFLGETICNTGSSQKALAGGIEYRRHIYQNLDWTVGWLYEGEVDLIRRQGITMQLCPKRAFFDNRLTLGIGFGAYLALDIEHNRRTGEEDDTNLSGVITPTISYCLTNSCLIRISWHRVVTNYNRDTDVILGGIGYKF